MGRGACEHATHLGGDKCGEIDDVPKVLGMEILFDSFHIDEICDFESHCALLLL